LRFAPAGHSRAAFRRLIPDGESAPTPISGTDGIDPTWAIERGSGHKIASNINRGRAAYRLPPSRLVAVTGKREAY